MYLLHGEPKPICEFFHHWANDNDHSPCSYGKRFDSIYRPLFSWSAHITCHVRRQKGIADAHKNANTYRKDDKQQYSFYNNVGGRVFSLVTRAKQSSYTHCIFHKPNGLLYYSKVMCRHHRFFHLHSLTEPHDMKALLPMYSFL